MTGLRAALFAIGLAAWIAPISTAAADEASATEAARAFEAADRTSSDAQKQRHLRAALEAHVQGFSREPSWRDAAGAMKAAERLELLFLASAWYWLATDNADYSEEYVSWQSRAVGIFDRSATLAFDFTQEPASISIDGEAVPGAGTTMRPLAISPGLHTVTATTASGATSSTDVDVPPEPKPIKARLVFTEPLAAGERDPRDPVVPLPPPPAPTNNWEDPLFVATVIGTITLAAGIAVGGGYLLLGEENPKSFDTAGGVALIVTELCLIGGGTALALMMD